MYRNPGQMKKAQGVELLNKSQFGKYIEMMFDINLEICYPLEDYTAVEVEKKGEEDITVIIVMKSGRIRKYNS